MFVPAQLLQSADDVIGLCEKTINFTQPSVILFYSLIDPKTLLESRWCLQTSRDRVVVRHVMLAGRWLENNPITAHRRSVDGGQRAVTVALSAKSESIFFPAKNHLPIPTVPPPPPSTARHLSDMGVSSR